MLTRRGSEGSGHSLAAPADRFGAASRPRSRFFWCCAVCSPPRRGSHKSAQGTALREHVKHPNPSPEGRKSPVQSGEPFVRLFTRDCDVAGSLDCSALSGLGVAFDASFPQGDALGCFVGAPSGRVRIARHQYLRFELANVSSPPVVATSARRTRGVCPGLGPSLTPRVIA
jgi:hypothetical protein